MMSVERLILVITALALFALAAVEGALVYSGHRAVRQERANAEDLVRRVAGNSVELPAERERVQAGEIITLWERMPVSESLTAWDFYPNPPRPSGR
jgi:hypothetical protein